jgi:hypothetical protein
MKFYFTWLVAHGPADATARAIHDEIVNEANGVKLLTAWGAFEQAELSDEGDPEQSIIIDCDSFEAAHHIFDLVQEELHFYDIQPDVRVKLKDELEAVAVPIAIYVSEMSSRLPNRSGKPPHILLAGGVAHIPGLAQAIEKASGMTVTVVEQGIIGLFGS